MLPTPALQGIDLKVEAGEFLAVLGPTGAGKTTLCLAMNGLVPQSTGGSFRGNVWVAGLNTKTQPVAELATQVGVVFQDSESQLFNMTVEDEVAFGPESLGLPIAEIECRTQWALDAVGLADLRTRSPAHLSGGQQRRLAIAAVLAMQPAILVLDEPTAGLDPLGRRAVLDVIVELRRQGATVLMVTQDSDAVATLADRVAILSAGRVVLEGTPQEVWEQVEHLHALGVDVPQMAELSHRLGIRPPWLSVDQAFQALAGKARSCSSIAAPGSPDGRGQPPPAQPAVTFEDVWHRYEGGAQALAGVDLAISSGEYVVLVGPNGSGKTTLAKHVNGLLRPQKGRVLVSGCDTRQTSIGELASQVGYVFQNPDHQIFAPTVWEEIAFGPRNLGLGRAEVESRVETAMAAFHLASLAGVPPATLGYGQRRLVTLAAVHAMQPQVLILDEPTAGLDRHLTGRLLAWVTELHRAGATIVLITHDTRHTAPDARCVVMDQGRVILDLPAGKASMHSEHLIQAGITPPPIAILSRKLDLPATPVAVDSFCRVFLCQTRETGAS
jgi:energy-coupling factor transport system ATP-binding protein